MNFHHGKELSDMTENAKLKTLEIRSLTINLRVLFNCILSTLSKRERETVLRRLGFKMVRYSLCEPAGGNPRANRKKALAALKLARRLLGVSELSKPRKKTFLPRVGYIIHQRRRKKNGLSRDQRIVNAVCQAYGVRTDKILRYDRTKGVSFARHVVMYLLSVDLKWSSNEIKDVLRRKDHGTVLYGVNKVFNLLKKEPALLEDLEKIRATY